jgi:hypothetical protein
VRLMVFVEALVGVVVVVPALQIGFLGLNCSCYQHNATPDIPSHWASRSAIVLEPVRSVSVVSFAF